MSRLNNVKKNVKASYLFKMISIFISFFSRTVFIRQLGAEYLGINGLFSNILGLLALAEFGFGSAMNFEMYKPVAEGNYSKTATLLRLYKKVYYIIGFTILALGLLVIPFLPELTKTVENKENINIYYLLFLLNTVMGYYSSYLFCLSNAEQKEYIYSYINLLTTLVTHIVQIIIIYVFHSFLGYLLVETICLFLKQIAIKIYFNKAYHDIIITPNTELDIETKTHIKKNMGGLIARQFADVLLHQTDNIIIALGLNILIIGYSDNYNMIANNLKGIVLALLTSVIPSLGNMIATEKKEKCFAVFKKYDLADYLIYAFCTVCLIELYQPFMTLWAGKDKLIDQTSMLLLCVSFYLAGRAHSFSNFKTASGAFHDIKITSIVSVVLNLAISIWGLKQFGLAGVYLGTCVAHLYENIRTLRLSYNDLTGHKVSKYYIKRILQVILLLVPTICLSLFGKILHPEESWIRFFCFAALTASITIIWYCLIYWRESDFQHLYLMFINGTKGLLNKRKYEG